MRKGGRETTEKKRKEKKRKSDGNQRSEYSKQNTDVYDFYFDLEPNRKSFFLLKMYFLLEK